MQRYFVNKIEDKFILSDSDFISTINLGVKKGSRGYGYELGTIIAKYYEKNKFVGFICWCWGSF